MMVKDAFHVVNRAVKGKEITTEKVIDKVAAQERKEEQLQNDQAKEEAETNIGLRLQILSHILSHPEDWKEKMQPYFSNT